VHVLEAQATETMVPLSFWNDLSHRRISSRLSCQCLDHCALSLWLCNVQRAQLVNAHHICFLFSIRRQNHSQLSNKLCGLLWGRHSMPPPPASGSLNSHPELSVCRSPCMSMMQVVILQPYTKSEVRGPFCSEDMAHFRSRH